MSIRQSADGLWEDHGEGNEERARAATRAVLIACWVCAERYAHAVHPDCVVCLGEGIVEAPVPEGIRPIVAARAASLGLDYAPAAAKVELRRVAGRIAPATANARGDQHDPGAAEKSQIGRLARSLIEGRGLGPKGWSKASASERRRMAAELVAMAGDLGDACD